MVRKYASTAKLTLAGLKPGLYFLQVIDSKGERKGMLRLIKS
jgi:hypothetical protein